MLLSGLQVGGIRKKIALIFFPLGKRRGVPSTLLEYLCVQDRVGDSCSLRLLMNVMSRFLNILVFLFCG